MRSKIPLSWRSVRGAITGCCWSQSLALLYHSTALYVGKIGIISGNCETSSKFEAAHDDEGRRGRQRERGRERDWEREIYIFQNWWVAYLFTCSLSGFGCYWSSYCYHRNKAKQKIRKSLFKELVQTYIVVNFLINTRRRLWSLGSRKVFIKYGCHWTYKNEEMKIKQLICLLWPLTKRVVIHTVSMLHGNEKQSSRKEVDFASDCTRYTVTQTVVLAVLPPSRLFCADDDLGPKSSICAPIILELIF